MVQDNCCLTSSIQQLFTDWCLVSTLLNIYSTWATSRQYPIFTFGTVSPNNHIQICLFVCLFGFVLFTNLPHSNDCRPLLAVCFSRKLIFHFLPGLGSTFADEDKDAVSFLFGDEILYDENVPE